MPNFSYTAINDQGRQVKGFIEANSIDTAQGMLVEQGHIPVSVKSAKKDSGSGKGTFSFFDSIKTSDIIMFTKQMRTMLKSGIPILQIFSILEDQTKNVLLKTALSGMSKDVKEGSTMTSVFRKNTKIFSPLYCGLINAGEMSGTMVEVLDRLTYILEHEYKVKRDIKSALAYPKMVVFVLIGAFFFLLNFVIPKFIGVFEKAGLELPLPTKICLIMYNGLQHYWPLMLITGFGLFFSSKFYFSTNNGAVVRDRTFISLPIVGPLFIKSAMSRFASILVILLASGVTVLSAFEILSATIGNAAIAKEFDTLSKQMSEGKGISAPLRRTKFFPPMVVNMIEVGEESGSLEEMLTEIASHYDEEVEYAVAGLAEAIGPILICVLTVVVGFFAMAIFMPMWDLTKMAK